MSSSKWSYGFCVQAAIGKICRENWAMGRVHTFGFAVGATAKSGRVWLPRWVAIPTWKNYSLIPPSFAPTSILPALQKTCGQEISPSRGGPTTKLHIAVDALGNPLRAILSARQIADINSTSASIENLPGHAMVADKGYDADHFVARIETAGAEAVIPPQSNRLASRKFDRHLYRARNLIESFFARLKHFRRIATRYDKLAKSQVVSVVHSSPVYICLVGLIANSL